MLFNSVTFLIFFAVISTISWTLPRTARLYLLFFSSLVFYGFWRFDFVLLMMTSVVVDYVIALRIDSAQKASVKRCW